MKKISIIALAIALSAVVLTSCKDTTDHRYDGDPAFTIEKDKQAGFTAPLAGNEDSPEVFTVRSNRDWVVKAQATYDWIKVYPAEGKLDGIFKVYVAKNLTFVERKAYFAYVVDGEEQPTLLTVIQPANVPMLSASDEIKCTKDGGIVKIPVTSTVDFDFKYPVESWFRVTSIGSTFVTIAVDPATAPRKGTLTLVGKGDYSNLVWSIKIIQGSNLLDLPVSWAFSASLMSDYSSTFSSSASSAAVANSLPAFSGEGYISFYFVDESVDVNKARTRVVGSTGQPYVTGVWPGDYWEFKIPAPNLPKGTKVRFTGKTRPSATGQKFWRMQISDGMNADSTYKFRDVPALKDTTLNGTKVQYTHEMLSAVDITVDETFELQNTVTDGFFIMRFICAGNWQAGGSGALSAPNGGTHRWSGAYESDTSPKFEVTYNPNE